MKITVETRITIEQGPGLPALRADLPVAMSFRHNHETGDNPRFYWRELRQAVQRAADLAQMGMHRDPPEPKL